MSSSVASDFYKLKKSVVGCFLYNFSLSPEMYLIEAHFSICGLYYLPLFNLLLISPKVQRLNVEFSQTIVLLIYQNYGGANVPGSKVCEKVK